MNSNRSRILTRVLWICAAIVLVVLICYLIFSCSLLNSDEVPLSSLSDKKFISYDRNYIIFFSEDATSFELGLPDVEYNNVTVSDYYENMIFFDIEDEAYIIAVIDESTLFLSNERVYLYLMQ